MRPFMIAGILFQVGCASLLTSTTMQRRLRAESEQASSEYSSAKQFEAQGKLEPAREVYLRLHETHPKDPEYLHRLAVVNTRLQRMGEASRYYEKARKLDPKNVRLLADMGYAAYLMGDLPNAEFILREATQLKPNDPLTTNNLALVVGMRGNLDESLELLKSVSSEAEAIASLAYIHAQRGETKMAEQRYREALAINPNLRYATKALAELEKRPSKQDLFAPLIPASAVVTKFDRKPTKASAIQQVNSFDDQPAHQKVVTANFTEPSFDFEEPAVPAVLDPEQNSDAQPLEAAAEREFEADVPFEEEAASPSIEMDSDDDEWAKD